MYFLKCFPFFQPNLYHSQDGFVSGRSCVTSLLRSTQDFAIHWIRKISLMQYFWIVVRHLTQKTV